MTLHMLNKKTDKVHQSVESELSREQGVGARGREKSRGQRSVRRRQHKNTTQKVASSPGSLKKWEELERREPRLAPDAMPHYNLTTTHHNDAL